MYDMTTMDEVEQLIVKFYSIDVDSGQNDLSHMSKRIFGKINCSEKCVLSRWVSERVGCSILHVTNFLIFRIDIN